MDTLRLQAVEVRQPLHGREVPIAGHNRKAQAGQKFFAGAKLSRSSLRGRLAAPLAMTEKA
jgi:hypothetical protein